MRRLVVLLALAVGIAAAEAAAMAPLDVPLEHWSYEFVERLAVRATLGRSFLGLAPLTRGEMASLVQRLDATVADGGWTPTSIESRQLAMLRAEFSEELADLGLSVPLLDRAYHVWSGDAWRLQAFWRGRERAAASDAEATLAGTQVEASVTLEPAAALLLADRVLAAVAVRYRVRTGTGTIVQTTAVQDGEAEFVFEPRDRFGIVRAVDPTLRYAGRIFRVGLERTRLRWGPSRDDPMLIANASPPLDALRFQIALGPVRFASVAGQLRAAQLDATEPPVAQRYLSAHRLEIGALSWLDLALSETLVYGDRGLDLAYLNPLAVLFVTQANLGDVDNALAGFDFRMRLGGRVQLYGECVLDDLNLRRGLDHYGNKFGLAAGFLWLGAQDWDLDGEWSWASRYTYTHHTPANRYEHYGATIGSRIGPDADRWTMGVRRRWSPGWSTRLSYLLERHGEGDLADSDEERPSDSVGYLSGTVAKSHGPGIEARYRGLRWIDLDAAYRYIRVVHPGNDPLRSPVSRHDLQVEARVEF